MTAFDRFIAGAKQSASNIDIGRQNALARSVTPRP